MCKPAAMLAMLQQDVDGHTMSISNISRSQQLHNAKCIGVALALKTTLALKSWPRQPAA